MERWIVEVSVKNSDKPHFVTYDGFLSQSPDEQGHFSLQFIPYVITFVFNTYGNLINNLETGVVCEDNEDDDNWEFPEEYCDTLIEEKDGIADDNR